MRRRRTSTPLPDRTLSRARRGYGRSPRLRLTRLKITVSFHALKVTVRFVLIVRAAPELKIVDVCRPACRERLHVMELEESGFTAPAVGTGKCAPALVARPDRALHR